MPIPEKALRLWHQFAALPPRPPRQRAAPKPPPTPAQQIWPDPKLLPDHNRGAVSPLDGRGWHDKGRQ